MDELLRYRLPHASEEERLETALEFVFQETTSIEDIKTVLPYITLTSFNTDGSTEAEDDCLDKSALPDSRAGHNKDTGILCIAAAYVNRRTVAGDTPLHLSAYIHETKFASLFLKVGADVNVENKFNETPLHKGVRRERIDIVEILLKSGANVNAENKFKETPLLKVAWRGRKDIVEILLKAGANVNAEDIYKKTPLHKSVLLGRKDIVEILMKAGANVNAEDNNKVTPLHKCVREGHKDIVEILLKAGANVNAEDNYKETPLHKSYKEETKDIIEILIKAGANVDAENILQKTPLHKSVEKGDNDIVEILLKAGAIVDAEDDDEETPLHYSAKNGHKDIVEILLKAGANVNAENTDKQTPLHYSAKNGHKDIVEILLKAGANVEPEDKCRTKTPLHYSIQFNHDDVTELLLHAGASAAKTDIVGRSVLDYMNGRQRVRFGYKPVSTFFRIRNWVYSVTKKSKSIQAYTSTRIETEHTETVSATFTESDSQAVIRCEESAFNNGQGHTSRDSSTLLTPGTSLSGSAVTSSVPGPSCTPSTSAEPQDPDDSDRQELNDIRQQCEHYLAKFSPEISEGCETSCSNNVKAALMAGRIVMYPTIHITQNKITKKIKKVYHYGPGTILNISYAEAVAPGGKVFVRKIRNVKNEEGNDDDDDDEVSSSEDETNNNV